MKCALLCFILVGFWRSIYCVPGETFEYECDILQRLGSLESKIVSLENKAIASDKVVADLEKVNNDLEKKNKDLENKVNEQAQLIIGLTNKVVTLEGKAASLENNVTSSNERISDLEIKDKDRDQLIASLEAKINASDKVIADPERVSDLENKVNEQEQLIIGLTNTVATLEEPVRNPGVIFHARSIIVQPTPGSIIKFRTIDYTNDPYSQTTGCFTAPRHGIYWFSAHVCTFAGKSFSPSIYVGETLIVRTRTYYKDNADCSTLSAVTRLQVNDLVCLKADPYSSSDAVWTEDAHFKTNHFMGALIYE